MRYWIPALAAACAPLPFVIAGTTGLVGVTVWYLSMLALPALALSVALVAAGHLAWRRKLDGWHAACAGAVALLALATAVMMGLVPVPYPALIARGPALAIRVPMDGEVRVYWGGDRIRDNYHAFTPDQRHAYDLGLDPSDFSATDPTAYGCWGQPVLAPLDAVVSSTSDGAPDATPGTLSNDFTNPLGNHVALRTPHDTFLVLAHLREGSVAVALGQAVTEGERLGLCGNSGNTSAPHLHIHHQRQDPAEFPVGFAEGLPLVFRDHEGPAVPTGGIEVEGETVRLLGGTIRHVGR